jgi:hypothetical protein
MSTAKTSGPWVAVLDLVCAGEQPKRTVKVATSSAKRAILLARDPKGNAWPAFASRRCRVTGQWVMHQESGLRLPVALWAGRRMGTGTGTRKRKGTRR